jgi:hypothetical protein
LAYDLLPLILPDTKMAFEPFYRYEHVDTQDKMPAGVTPEPGRERNIHIVGVSFFPHPQIVVKLDYRNAQATDGTPIPDTVQVGLGFIF